MSEKAPQPDNEANEAVYDASENVPQADSQVEQNVTIDDSPETRSIFEQVAEAEEASGEAEYQLMLAEVAHQTDVSPDPLALKAAQVRARMADRRLTQLRREARVQEEADTAFQATPEGQLATAKDALLKQYIESEGFTTKVTSDADKIIAGFEAKRTELAEKLEALKERRKSRPHAVFGEVERNLLRQEAILDDQRAELDRIWQEIGGGEVDAAREALAATQAEANGAAEPTAPEASEESNEAPKAPEPASEPEPTDPEPEPTPPTPEPTSEPVPGQEPSKPEKDASSKEYYGVVFAHDIGHIMSQVNDVFERLKEDEATMAEVIEAGRNLEGYLRDHIDNSPQEITWLTQSGTDGLNDHQRSNAVGAVHKHIQELVRSYDAAPPSADDEPAAAPSQPAAPGSPGGVPASGGGGAPTGSEARSLNEVFAEAQLNAVIAGIDGATTHDELLAQQASVQQFASENPQAREQLREHWSKRERELKRQPSLWDRLQNGANWAHDKLAASKGEAWTQDPAKVEQKRARRRNLAMGARAVFTREYYGFAPKKSKQQPVAAGQQRS